MITITEKRKGGAITYHDKKDRVVMSINKSGRVVIGRYHDMENEIKEYLMEVFEELTKQSQEKTKRFLDFEDEEDVFCT